MLYSLNSFARRSALVAVITTQQMCHKFVTSLQTLEKNSNSCVQEIQIGKNSSKSADMQSIYCFPDFENFIRTHSWLRNHDFCSLPSLITCDCMHRVYVGRNFFTMCVFYASKEQKKQPRLIQKIQLWSEKFIALGREETTVYYSFALYEDMLIIYMRFLHCTVYRIC